MKLKLIVLLILAVLISSCGILNTAGDVADTISKILSVRGASVKLDRSGDSVQVIRTYPHTIFKIIAGRDSTYVLNSGDKIHLQWMNDTTAITYAEIVPDTVKIQK